MNGRDGYIYLGTAIQKKTLTNIDASLYKYDAPKLISCC